MKLVWSLALVGLLLAGCSNTYTDSAGNLVQKRMRSKAMHNTSLPTPFGSANLGECYPKNMDGCGGVFGHAKYVRAAQEGKLMFREPDGSIVPLDPEVRKKLVDLTIYQELLPGSVDFVGQKIGNK